MENIILSNSSQILALIISHLTLDSKTEFDSPGHGLSENTANFYQKVTDDVTGQVKSNTSMINAPLIVMMQVLVLLVLCGGPATADAGLGLNGLLYVG